MHQRFVCVYLCCAYFSVWSWCVVIKSDLVEMLWKCMSIVIERVGLNIYVRKKAWFMRIRSASKKEREWELEEQGMNEVGANQPVHLFFKGKALGIQQGTSVWIGSSKLNEWAGLDSEGSDLQLGILKYDIRWRVNESWRWVYSQFGEVQLKGCSP